MTEIVESKSGEMTVRKDGVYLLSHYHPRRDAEKLVRENSKEKKAFYVLFGSALGYSVDALLETGAERGDMAVFEPDAVIAEYFKGKYPDIRMIEPGASIAEWMEKELMEQKKPVFLSLESYRKYYPEASSLFYSDFSGQLKIAVENMKVSVFFSKIWFVNFFRNIQTAEIGKNCFYPDAAGKVSDWPFLVIAAGPSLNGKLEDIRKVKDSCVIIAVLSAARTLVRNGIRPDLIIASDAGVGNKMHAFGIPEDIPVLANVYASSCLLSGLRNPLVFYNLKEEIAQLSFVLKYPSVTMDAGLLAEELTSGPIVFCGFDLGYDILGGSHSAGNAFLEMRSALYYRLNPLYGSLSSFLKRKDVQPLGGNDRWFTHKQFLMVKRSVEERFPGKGYSGEGAKFEGLVRIGNLADALPVRGKGEKEKETAKIRSIFAKYENIRPHLSKILDRYKKDFAAANSDMSRKVLLRENLTGMDVQKAKNYIYRKIEAITRSDGVK